ncbi:MAG: helix-turn-helix domain-containing protein [Sporichthyaceae bacterium]
MPGTQQWGRLPSACAYVDAGCSQQETAARMFLHAKIIECRLVQIEKLTGLDLTDHHARMQVDIAVRAAELFGCQHQASAR